MDLWAHCDGCRRWFYCAGAARREAPSPRCPVCGRAPALLEDRADPQRPRRIERWDLRLELTAAEVDATA